MDYSLEVIQRKEGLLRALRGIQAKAEGTLQRAAPLLSLQRGMGMVSQEEVRQLSQSAAGLCRRLDNLETRLGLRQNVPAGRLAGGPASPWAVHVAADGTAYVSSREEARISVLTGAGRRVRELGCATREGLFLPEDVTLTRAGMVAAVDLPGGKVRVFNPHSRSGRGEWVSLGDFASPRGVAVDAFGRLLVADYQPGKVHVFGVGPSLRLLSVRSVTGLSGPRHVCGTPDGGFAVSEECGGVKLYGPRHRLLRSLGETPAFRLGNPAGVAVDPGGNVLVADEQERSVVLFPPRGEPVAVVTEGLRKPAGLACCERGRVYVADPPDGCVKVFCYRGDRH